MSLELVQQNAEPFLRTLTEARPQTPILLIEDRTHADAWLRPEYLPTQRAKQAAFCAIADKLRSSGASIEYVEGATLIGADSEATTDGSHPSDLGAMRYAGEITPALKKILRTEQSKALP